MYIYLNISILASRWDSIAAFWVSGLNRVSRRPLRTGVNRKSWMDPAHSQVTPTVINNSYFAALSSCPGNESKLCLLFGHPSCFSWCFSCQFCSFTPAVVNLSTYFSVPVSSSLLRRWCDSAMSHESLCYHVLSCSSREDSACQKPLWLVPSHWCLSVCGVFLASN